MSESLPSPLQSIADDIRRCLGMGLYYPALVVALTIPEICSGLTKTKDKFVKSGDYIRFVNKYTTPPSLGVNGDVCYRIRGGVIHRGSGNGNDYFPGTHLMFAVPESDIAIHAYGLDYDNRKYYAIGIDLILFCEALIGALEQWYAEHGSNKLVKQQLSGIVSLRPNGLPPFVVGTPVVGSGEEYPDLQPMFQWQGPPSKKA